MRALLQRVSRAEVRVGGEPVGSIGAGLLVTFGTSSFAWAAFYAVLTVAGALFIADGLYWHLPAERMRRQFTYCYCDVEIAVPDYGRPSRTWETAVFSHDDL